MRKRSANNGWAATESCRDCAQRGRVLPEGQTEAAGLLPSFLSHRWESYDQPHRDGLRYHPEQMTGHPHTHTYIHTQTHTQLWSSHFMFARRKSFTITLISQELLCPGFLQLKLLLETEGYHKKWDCFITVWHISWTSEWFFRGNSCTIFGLSECFSAATLIVWHFGIFTYFLSGRKLNY